MTAIAEALVKAGWRVRFITGRPFADAVTAVGAEFVVLTPEYDHVLTPPAKGRESINHVKDVFFEAVPAQAQMLRRLISAEHTDAVFHDLAFVGPRVLLAAPPDRRPLVIACGVFPLILSSRDTAPFGAGLPPATTAARRWRYRWLSAFVQHVALRPVHQAVDELWERVGAPPRDGRFFMDLSADGDVFAEFSVPGFEYPRSDLPANVRFFGPASVSLTSMAPLPEWWDRLDDRPIVHVTQGTSFNDEPERLIVPTIQALADRPVQVVVATGGRAAAELGTLPANVFAASFLPYDRLFERTSVLVTNGGFGTVLQALGHGVPIVAGSGIGDQIETAARVAWAGVGIDLGKKIPTSGAIASAVDRVLDDPDFRTAAKRLSLEIQASTGAAGLVHEVERLVVARVTS
jgi:MGT family glycosyltransferase